MNKNSNNGNECLLISKCLKKEDKHYYFRFYGTYKGSYVKKVKIRSDLKLEVNEIYVLTLKVNGVKELVLYGVVKEAKMLEDYTWL